MTRCFIKISGLPNQSGPQVFCPPLPPPLSPALPLPIVLSESKIDKKRVPFSVLSLQEPIDKKGTLFHLLQANVIAR